MTDKATLIAHGENILIRVPMRFKRRGGRKEIIAPEGLGAALPANAPAQEALVAALTRAHRWRAGGAAAARLTARSEVGTFWLSLR